MHPNGDVRVESYGECVDAGLEGEYWFRSCISNVLFPSLRLMTARLPRPNPNPNPVVNRLAALWCAPSALITVVIVIAAMTD